MHLGFEMHSLFLLPPAQPCSREVDLVPVVPWGQDCFLRFPGSEGSPGCSNGLFTLSALHYFLTANTKGPCHRERSPKALTNVTYIHSSMDRDTHTETLKEEHKAHSHTHTHQHSDTAGDGGALNSRREGVTQGTLYLLSHYATHSAARMVYSTVLLFQSKEGCEKERNKKEECKENGKGRRNWFRLIVHLHLGALSQTPVHEISPAENQWQSEPCKGQPFSSAGLGGPVKPRLVLWSSAK